MSILTKLRNWIGTTGENIKFIAFMAHMGIMANIMLIFRVNIIAIIVAIVIAAVKEFWFDLHYERHPPQTVKDSTLDFIGYMTGIVLALLIYYFIYH